MTLSPQSTWPRYMQRATALRYCDMSESTFNENMKRGGLPQPLQMPTGILLWDRNDIDEHLEKLKRVAPDTTTGVRNAREAQIEARR
jgi:predicted DNA-binding transcriptional regulator AlpA